MMAESGGTAADKVKPERGGACRCWASPRGGWSVIQKVNTVSVTVLDNWGNGGRNFTRTIPFDKLTAVMSKSDVDAKRAAGLLADSHSGIGFFLLDAPPPGAKPRAEPERTKFDDLADALKARVRVVSAPQLFPTPPDLAARVVALADIRPGQTVLEPSAGTGNLVRAIRDAAPRQPSPPSRSTGSWPWRSPRFSAAGPRGSPRPAPTSSPSAGSWDSSTGW
jgi:hypothetical protein